MGNELKTKKTRLIIINLSIVLLSILFSLVVCELGLRIFDYSAPIFRKTDSDLGWTLYPGIHGWHRKETKNYLRINDQRRNDGVLDSDKSTTTIRIAIIGDSFAQSAEVPREKSFISLLESELNIHIGSHGKKLEVLNFGVVGYGATQQLLTLRKKVWRYDPDIVVLAVFIGNDVSDNHIALAESLKSIRPYFRVKDGKLVRDPRYPDPNQIRKDQVVIELVNHSRLLQLLKEVFLRRNGWHMRMDGPPPRRKPKIVDAVFSPPQTKEWSEAWNITEKLILTINDEVRDRSKEFFMLIIPEPIQVHPKSEVRNAFIEELGLENLFYPEIRLASLAKSNAIPFLSLTTELLSYGESNGVYLHGFESSNLGSGHWNEVGHQVVSNLLASSLKPMLTQLVPKLSVGPLNQN